MSRYTLHHGDCLDVLRTLPDDSVDAVVTDPPYGLAESRSRKNVSERIYHALVEVGFPYLYQLHTEFSEGVNFSGVLGNCAPLGVEDRAVRKEARIGVPKRAVDLKGDLAVNQEIN